MCLIRSEDYTMLTWLFKARSHDAVVILIYFSQIMGHYRPQTNAKVMFSQVSVCPWGACVAGGACMAGGVCGMHEPQQILRDTVNERAVRILLEYILVCD